MSAPRYSSWRASCSNPRAQATARALLEELASVGRIFPSWSSTSSCDSSCDATAVMPLATSIGFGASEEHMGCAAAIAVSAKSRGMSTNRGDSPTAGSIFVSVPTTTTLAATKVVGGIVFQRTPGQIRNNYCYQKQLFRCLRHNPPPVRLAKNHVDCASPHTGSSQSQAHIDGAVHTRASPLTLSCTAARTHRRSQHIVTTLTRDPTRTAHSRQKGPSRHAGSSMKSESWAGGVPAL